MEQRFEIFTKSITSIYRSVQKIKSTEMTEFGLKGMHVMCLFFLGKRRDGLTSAQLCRLCDEDKAAVSRAIALLKEKGFVKELQETAKKKYRNIICLTEEGGKVAEKVSDKVENALNAGGAGLSEEERVTFYASLQLIAGNLEKYFKCMKEKEGNEPV